MFRITPYLIIVFATSFNPGVVIADEDSKLVEELVGRVKALEIKMTEMKKTIESLKASQPTVTMLMPNFSERLHVMHYAGEAGDWAVASHELMGLEHLVSVMQQVDPAIGAMASGFLDENFKQLDSAIEHENLESFKQSLKATIKSCNSCHVAAGSPSMNISLNANDSLSMRHSHNFGKSKKPGNQMHTH